MDELSLYDKQQLNNAQITFYNAHLQSYELQSLNTARISYYNAQAGKAWAEQQVATAKIKLIEAKARLINLQADEQELLTNETRNDLR